MQDAVGPVLRMSDAIPAVVRAIEDDNPGTQMETIDRGAYMRIQAPIRLRVTRDSIERNLGRAFEMRELEAMMAAFAGRIDTSTDEIVWFLTRETQAPTEAA